MGTGLETANIGDIETFSPDDYLVGVLRRAIEKQVDVMISLDRHGEIGVRPTRGEIFTDSVANIDAFCAMPGKSYKVRAMSNEERTRYSGRRPNHNIDEIMWICGFFASRGRMIEGAQFDVVRIRHWPNLTRLPFTQNTMRILALLTRYPTSLTVTHRLLKIEMSEVLWNYSAARCAGLVHVVNAAEQPVIQPHRHQTLLSQLLGKIARL